MPNKFWESRIDDNSCQFISCMSFYVCHLSRTSSVKRWQFQSFSLFVTWVFDDVSNLNTSQESCWNTPSVVSLWIQQCMCHFEKNRISCKMTEDQWDQTPAGQGNKILSSMGWDPTFGGTSADMPPGPDLPRELVQRTGTLKKEMRNKKTTKKQNALEPILMWHPSSQTVLNSLLLAWRSGTNICASSATRTTNRTTMQQWCFGEDFQRRLRVKRKEDMRFIDVFKTFIEIERPQNAELCDFYKGKVSNMQASSFPAANSTLTFTILTWAWWKFESISFALTARTT